jgi:Icc-related predicted phosphoesterase
MTTNQQLEHVAIFGDWHGDIEWAKACVRWVAKEGLDRALHVGDFAIGFYNNRQYTKPLNHLCKQLGIKLYITPGNHENYDVIEQLSLIEEGEDAGWLYLASNLLVAPRGLRFNWGGVNFVSLGGGNSIDFDTRTQGRDWWAAERITMADIEKVEAGGRADVMITHVAPTHAKYYLEPSYFTDAQVRYSDESRMVMDMVLDTVQPKLFFHGHYHQSKRQRLVVEDTKGGEFTTEFISLGMNKHVDNAAILTLSVEIIEDPRVRNDDDWTGGDSASAVTHPESWYSLRDSRS